MRVSRIRRFVRCIVGGNRASGLDLGRRVWTTVVAISMVGSMLGAGAAAALEYPATWSISGNTATGTTPSGVVVTATVTGPASFVLPSGFSLILTGSKPSYFPATTTQALRLLIAGCGGPSCGSITYTFSQPVAAPVLYIGDVGAGSVSNGLFITYHDSPVTLASGTFSLDAAGSQTANMSIQNSGATIGITDPASLIGTSGRNPSSCGTFGCGVYDISTTTPTVTSVSMSFGSAGTGTPPDDFNLILATNIAPVTAVPALNRWMLLLLAGLLGVVGLVLLAGDHLLP